MPGGDGPGTGHRGWCLCSPTPGLRGFLSLPGTVLESTRGREGTWSEGGGPYHREIWPSIQFGQSIYFLWVSLKPGQLCTQKGNHLVTNSVSETMGICWPGMWPCAPAGSCLAGGGSPEAFCPSSRGPAAALGRGPWARAQGVGYSRAHNSSSLQSTYCVQGWAGIPVPTTLSSCCSASRMDLQVASASLGGACWTPLLPAA